MPEKGYYQIYESGKSGNRMSSVLGHFEETESISSDEDEKITLILRPHEQFQKILGFGGAFTGAACENIQSLNIEARQRLLEWVFSMEFKHKQKVRYEIEKIIIVTTASWLVNIFKISRSYFGQDGSRYNLGRVPIGGSDFSQERYTYADTRDDLLRNFTLQQEDYYLKIPVMQEALDTNPELLFTAATSYVPEWMKTEHDEFHAGN